MVFAILGRLLALHLIPNLLDEDLPLAQLRHDIRKIERETDVTYILVDSIDGGELA